MRFTLPLLAALSALTRAQSDFPSCIQDCIRNTPTSSTCTGDETGQDLADCTCDSLGGTGLLVCFSDCSPEDQTDYLDSLDKSCRDELFPDAGSSDDDDDSDEGPSQTDDEDTRETGQSGDDGDDGEDAAAGLSASIVLAAGGVMAALFM